MMGIDDSINPEEDAKYDEGYDNEEFEKLGSDNDSELAQEELPSQETTSQSQSQSRSQSGSQSQAMLAGSRVSASKVTRKSEAKELQERLMTMLDPEKWAQEENEHSIQNILHSEIQELHRQLERKDNKIREKAI